MILIEFCGRVRRRGLGGRRMIRRGGGGGGGPDIRQAAVFVGSGAQGAARGCPGMAAGGVGIRDCMSTCGRGATLVVVSAGRVRRAVPYGSGRAAVRDADGGAHGGRLRIRDRPLAAHVRPDDRAQCRDQLALECAADGAHQQQLCGAKGAPAGRGGGRRGRRGRRGEGACAPEALPAVQRV